MKKNSIMLKGLKKEKRICEEEFNKDKRIEDRKKDL